MCVLHIDIDLGEEAKAAASSVSWPQCLRKSEGGGRRDRECVCACVCVCV